MSITHGPKSILNGLVLSLDSGNPRSYPGEPTVNLCGDMSTFTTRRPVVEELDTNCWNSDVIMPPENIGKVYKQISGSLTSTWDGNSYGYWHKLYTYDANTQYTLSTWVFLSEDCNIDNIPCTIEGTDQRITEVFYDMTKKGTWQRIYLTINHFSILNSNIIPVYPAKNGVTNGVFTGFFMWGGCQLEKKSHPTAFTSGTRNLWKDLSRNGNNVDLSNMSFDSDGNMIFNGSTTRILNTSLSSNIIPLSNNIPRSFEAVINTTSTSDQAIFGFKTSSGCSMYCDGGLYLYSNTIIFNWYPNSGNYLFLGTHSFSINTWYHIVATYDSSNIPKLYINGVLTDTYTSVTNLNYGDRQGEFTIGYNDVNATSEYFSGKIPIIKYYYNRALTQDNITTEFNLYKERFGIV